ncbi:MAG: hypothetical protein AAF889_06485 [Cyanobacteria bacterium P01_D01_bin.73]
MANISDLGKPSIYQHIKGSIDPKTGCIVKGAGELPDEPEAKPGELKWASGALDGVMSHHVGGFENTAERVETITHLVIEISKHNRAADKLELYKTLGEGDLVQCLDSVLEKVYEQEAITFHLHEYVRFLAREASARDPVKFAIALLGIIGDRDDKELIMTLGKHEEFTLFSSVALINMEKNPDISLYELAQYVDGWGKIQVVERLSETDNPRIKAWMLREGYKNSIMYEYLVLICAQTGNLLDALQETQIDQNLFDGSGDIINSLIMGDGSPVVGISGYKDASKAIPRYLSHFSQHSKSLSHFLTLHSIKEYLSEEEWNQQVEEESGWRKDLREATISKIDQLLDDAEWPKLARDALASEDNFYEGDLAARKLGIKTWDIHWNRLKKVPSESGRWFSVMRKATPGNIDQILELAEKVMPFTEIATGPADAVIWDSAHEWHSCLDYVLQDLKAFPGKGKRLILMGLKSPVIRNRNMALKALSSWPVEMRDCDVQASLEVSLNQEPDVEVKERIQKLIEGLDID